MRQVASPGGRSFSIGVMFGYMANPVACGWAGASFDVIEWKKKRIDQLGDGRTEGGPVKAAGGGPAISLPTPEYHLVLFSTI